MYKLWFRVVQLSQMSLWAFFVHTERVNYYCYCKLFIQVFFVVCFSFHFISNFTVAIFIRKLKPTVILGCTLKHILNDSLVLFGSFYPFYVILQFQLPISYLIFAFTCYCYLHYCIFTLSTGKLKL